MKVKCFTSEELRSVCQKLEVVANEKKLKFGCNIICWNAIDFVDEKGSWLAILVCEDGCCEIEGRKSTVCLNKNDYVMLNKGCIYTVKKVGERTKLCLYGRNMRVECMDGTHEYSDCD